MQNKKNEIFNLSFYRQKQPNMGSENVYVSQQYMKKYTQSTQITNIISRSIRSVLDTKYLPQNPYNMLGRLLLHEAIFENLRVHRQLEGNRKKGKEQQIHTQKMKNQESLVKVELAAVTLWLGWRFKAMVNLERVEILWKELLGNKAEDMMEKYKASKIIQAIGGTYLLKTGNPFSSSWLIKLGCIMYMSPENNASHYTRFVNFVLQDCLRICDSGRTHFIKLWVREKEGYQTEYSIDNLLHNRTKVIKQLTKNLMLTEQQVYLEYIQHSQKTPCSYLRVKKAYILVETHQVPIIHCLHPVTLLLTMCTNSYDFHQTITQTHKHSTIDELINIYNLEMHSLMLESVLEQEPAEVGWVLYWMHLYDGKDYGELHEGIDFMVASPMAFLDQAKYFVNVAKIITRSANTEQEVRALLQHVSHSLDSNVSIWDIFPDCSTYLTIIKRIITLLLDHPYQLSHLLQLQHMFTHLTTMFYHICLVYRGQIQQQMMRIDNTYGQDDKIVLQSMITYELLLKKYKSLSDRTLNLPQELKRLRKSIQLPQSQLRELILLKYLEKYELYERVYGFYWKMVCERKVPYPLTNFLKLLKTQAIKHDYQTDMDDQHIDVQSIKHEGVMIMKKPNNKYLFYAFNGQILADQKVKDYRIIVELFQEHFEQNLPEQLQQTKYQLPQYLISIESKTQAARLDDANFNRCKLYIDIVCEKVQGDDVYGVMYDEIMKVITKLDESGYGVLGLCGGEEEMDGDRVRTWVDAESKFDVSMVRYYHKRPLNPQATLKLLRVCARSNQQVQLKTVFSLKGLIKGSIFSFNFLFSNGWFLNQVHTYQRRVFYSFDTINKWMSKTSIKKYMQEEKKLDKKEQKLTIIQGKYVKNQIELLDMLAESEQQAVDSGKIRKYSPFYGQMQQALALSLNLFDLYQYVKVDGGDHYQPHQLEQTMQMLQYHLFDKCLKKDKYSFSEGLSVSVVNIITRILRYMKHHSDNFGDEREIIHVQGLLGRFISMVRFLMLGCGLTVLEAIRTDT